MLIAPAVLLAACTDARGYNAFQAVCVDRDGLQQGTPAFAACVAREQHAFEENHRRAHRITGTQ